MLTTHQINIARMYGDLYRIHGGNTYGRKVENLYYEWAGQNVPHSDHEDLHVYFRDPAQVSTPTYQRVRTDELRPDMIMADGRQIARVEEYVVTTRRSTADTTTRTTYSIFFAGSGELPLTAVQPNCTWKIQQS